MIAALLAALALAAPTPATHHRCHWTKTVIRLYGHTSIEWARRCPNGSVLILRAS